MLADVSIAKLLLLVLSYTVIVLYVIVLSLCVRLARCNKININTSIVTIEKAVCNGYVSPSWSLVPKYVLNYQEISLTIVAVSFFLWERHLDFWEGFSEMFIWTDT